MNNNSGTNDNMDRGAMSGIVEEVTTYLGRGQKGDEVTENSILDVTPGGKNTPPEVRDESADEDTGTPTG